MIHLHAINRLQLTILRSALSHNQQRLVRGLQPVVSTPRGDVLGSGDAQHVSTREGICSLPLTYLSQVDDAMGCSQMLSLHCEFYASRSTMPDPP